MEFELKISGLNEAPNIAYGWADRVISILDVESSSKPNFSCVVEHYTAVFDDVTSDKNFEKGYVEATYENIKNILDFTANITEKEKVLIHCHAGMSRSPGIAYLVCAQHEQSPAHALTTVRRAAHSLAVPNKRIVEIGEKILKIGNSHSRFLRLWIEENHIE